MVLQGGDLCEFVLCLENGVLECASGWEVWVCDVSVWSESVNVV